MECAFNCTNLMVYQGRKFMLMHMYLETGIHKNIFQNIFFGIILSACVVTAYGYLTRFLTTVMCTWWGHNLGGKYTLLSAHMRL